jgi:tetratricopeptide (TPR) repeat protein
MIQSLECPSCGGRLQIDSLNTTLTDCTFCGARLIFLGPQTLSVAKTTASPATNETKVDLSPIFARAVLLKQQGDVDGALAVYQRILSLSPDNTQALYASVVLYKEKGDLQRALAVYEDILRIKPDDTNALYGRAVLFKQLGDIDSALGTYQAILRIKPEDTNALASVAVLYKQKGEIGAAIAVYEQIDRIKNGK